MGCCLPTLLGSSRRTPSASPLIPPVQEPQLRCRKCRVALFPTLNAQLTHEATCLGKVRMDLPPAPTPPPAPLRPKAEPPAIPKNPQERLEDLKAGIGGGGVGMYLEKVKSKRGLDPAEPEGDDGEGGEDKEEADEGGDEREGVMKSLRNVFRAGRKGGGGGTKKESKHLMWLQTSYR